MTRYMCSARIDERGRIAGGKSGDQSGEEVMVQPYYDFRRDGYTCVALRYEGDDKYAVRNRSIKANVRGANADLVGYDQGQRSTFYAAMRKLGWKLANIAKTGTCETDCSQYQGTCSNIARLPILSKAQAIPADVYTGNMRSYFERVGYKVVSGINWSTGAGLRAGDVLVRHQASRGLGHTAMYIGTKPSGSLYVDTYKVIKTRYLYANPKKQLTKRKKKSKKGATLKYLHKKSGNWRYVEYGGVKGWVYNGGKTKAIKVKSYA